MSKPSLEKPLGPDETELKLDVTEADKLIWMKAAAEAQLSLEEWIAMKLNQAARTGNGGKEK